MTTNVIFVNELSELALLSEGPTISAYNSKATRIKQLKWKDTESKIHIRRHARSGRKHTTTIQGLPSILDMSKIVKALKKSSDCGGSIITDPEFGDIIQLTGDQREKVLAYLLDQGICHKNQVVVH